MEKDLIDYVDYKRKQVEEKIMLQSNACLQFNLLINGEHHE